MLNYKAAFQQAYTALQPLYDKQEASAIANRLLEDISGLSYTQRLVKQDENIPDDEAASFANRLRELKNGKPLQYVLGYEWFIDRKYIVNEHVLIPRPETEELVQWIVDDNKNSQALSILDIGTGSGCIPISLGLALPHATVTSCDISKDAIDTAWLNAQTMHAEVGFIEMDFLNKTATQQLPQYDVIVSNPPYIPETEKENMHSNVKDHEPSIALFVPSDDALLFYKAIAQFGKTHLKPNGTVYCELHIDHALQTAKLFEATGYTDVTVKKDMHGNLRMLKVTQA